MSLHQAGFDSAVASLGTSLTPEQARLISRYTNEVVIAYDNDGAGMKASQRAIGILEKLDLRVKVLRMSGAKDPDEFIKLKGPDAFRNLIDAAENQVDYRLRAVTDKYDLTVDEQKVEFLKEASELVARLPGSVERQVYAMRVASMAGVDARVVTDEAERRRKKLLSQAHRADRDATRPERQSQPAEKGIRYENPASAVAEEGVIRLLYLEPELAAEALPEAREFSSPVLAHIYTEMREMLDSGQKVSTTTLSATRAERRGDEPCGQYNTEAGAAFKRPADSQRLYAEDKKRERAAQRGARLRGDTAPEAEHMPTTRKKEKDTRDKLCQTK